MDDINNGITYVFGEDAALDGEVNPGWIADFFYYKNTPLAKDFFAKIRDIFWGFLKTMIDLFNQ